MRTPGFEDGFFAFLHPKDNDRCTGAVSAYKACLKDEASFAAWTLEDVVTAIRKAGAKGWVDVFEDRHLAFGRLGERRSEQAATPRHESPKQPVPDRGIQSHVGSDKSGHHVGAAGPHVAVVSRNTRPASGPLSHHMAQLFPLPQ